MGTREATREFLAL